MATLVNVSTFSAADPPATATPGTDFLRNLYKEGYSAGRVEVQADYG
jgi:hypothetical protein